MHTHAHRSVGNYEYRSHGYYQEVVATMNQVGREMIHSIPDRFLKMRALQAHSRITNTCTSNIIIGN